MLIAEIGSCHLGDFKRAKLMIKMAHESGADLIKSQVFLAKDIIEKGFGSMDLDFYMRCQFEIEQYIELIEYARDIGNDLFYSIFSPGFERISIHQNWHKLAGKQTILLGKSERLSYMDHENVIVSVPKTCDLTTLPYFKQAELLYVSDYLEQDPDLKNNMAHLSGWHGRSVGYSDHTLGILNCVKAYTDFGATIIEKHFCLENHVQVGGKLFRDTVHGASPREFAQLAKIMDAVE